MDRDATSFASPSHGNTNSYVFDVFLNHRGPDVKKTLASHIYRRLNEHGIKVFVDQQGENFTGQIEEVIRTASVHVAIFSPKYAKSSWCLKELLLMLESGSTIIPVFYKVKPSDLRWARGGDGVYARSLGELEKKRKHDSQPRYDSNTIGKWRDALSAVADISGFELEACNGDEGELVDKVVQKVLKKVPNSYVYDVFLNHRGPDVKKTLASHIYRGLKKHGIKVFLDQKELQEGEDFTEQIKGAIRTASVHLAIFSSTYAESSWCLEELVLMLESGSTVIPVFYHVKPSDLRGAQGGDGVYARSLGLLEEKRTHDSQPLYESNTIRKWRDALSAVADIRGFVLEACNGDEGELVDKVVQKVLIEVPKEVDGEPDGPPKSPLDGEPDGPWWASKINFEEF